MLSKEEILENRKKWCGLLRSGEFKQGNGLLHRPAEDTWCCLGVAAVMLEGRDNFKKASRYTTADGLAAYLNKETRSKLGITEGTQRDLATMNDSGTSFDAIAAWIETHEIEDTSDDYEDPE